MQVDYNNIHIRAQVQVDYNNKVHEYQLKWQKWNRMTEDMFVCDMKTLDTELSGSYIYKHTHDTVVRSDNRL